MSKLIILMGLPGSGKTTFANEYIEKNRLKSMNIIHVDEYRYRKYDPISNVEDIINRYYNTHVKENIIDGLFLKNQDVIRLISCVPECVDEVEIHYWNPDIEKCLYNDVGRRRKSSKTTILNSKMEPLDLNLIKEATKVKKIQVITHEIIKKPLWKRKSDDLGLYIEDGHYLCSSSWSLGGTYGNCWNDYLCPVSADEQPTDFSEFDHLLEEICPSISFLQYKAIYKECIDIQTINEGDYYGGCVTYAFYRCDLIKLFNLLEEKELIESLS